MNKDKATEDKSGSRAIARALLDASSLSTGDWSANDLASLLEHQLRTPLHLEAERLLEHAVGPREAAVAALQARPPVTFFDVLQRGATGDGVLHMVKGYAKEALARDGVLPREIARFLYIASILRARAAGAKQFTSLDDASIDSEARRCLTLTWLPATARDLLRRGLGGA